MKHHFYSLLSISALLTLPLVSSQAQNVGIGTTAPTQPLDVNGNLRVRGLSTPGLLQTDANGNISAVATAYSTAGSGPLNPALASTTTGLNNPLVAVSGNLAVVLNRGANTLSLYDMSNPTAPVLRGTATGVNGGVEVAISGTMAAVLSGAGTGSMQLYALGSGAPTPVGGTLTPPASSSGLYSGIALSGSRLYAAFDRGGNYGNFYVYDVSTPATPVLLNGMPPVGTGPTNTSGFFTPQTVAAAGNFVAVGNAYAGATIINVSNPASTTSVGNTGSPGYNGADQPVAMTTTTLVMLTIPTNTLSTYSLSATGVPTLRNTFTTGSNPVSVAISGDLAYVTCRGSNTLQVIDVSGSSAVLRGAASLNATPNNVALGSTFALAANGAAANNLQAFTINPPRSITVAADGTVGTTALPTPNDYIQNQPAATQTGSFNLSGSGYLGGGATVVGTTSTSNLTVTGLSAGSVPFVGTGGAVNQNNANLFFDNANNRLGVGTNAPLARLQVQGGADSDGSSDPGALAFSWRSGGYRHFLRSRHNGSLGGGGNSLDFFLNNSASATGSSAAGTGNVQVMTLENNNGSARVGIGTTAPAYPLDVAGMVNSTTALLVSGAAAAYRTGNNMFLGTFNLPAATPTGTANTFVGGNGGLAITTGINNSTLGLLAGDALTTGSSNTFVGIQTGGSTTTGSENVFVGHDTGINNVSGSFNVGLGYASLLNTTGSANVAVGPSAGVNVTSGQNNTLLGANADFSGSTQRNRATAIGYNAKVDQDDAVVLGDASNAATRVGIATATPSSTLQVNGSLAVKVGNNLAGNAGAGGSGTPLGDVGYAGLNPTAANGGNYYLLPTASSCPGRIYYLRNNSGSFIAYLGTGTGTNGGSIFEGGSAAASPFPYQLQTTGATKTVMVISDGTNWTLIRNGN